MARCDYQKQRPVTVGSRTLPPRVAVRLAIDDFGTGYSSLSYLDRLPVDLIKIDKSFVDRLELSKESALVDTIVQMSQILGLKIIAEGIERPSQADHLRHAACDFGQGFLYSKPVDANAIRALIEATNLAPSTGR